MTELVAGSGLRSPQIEGELSSQVRSGLGWSLLNSVISRVANVALGILLARLLVPHDYGVFAVGLVFMVGLGSMNELGTSVAIVRWRGDVERAARTAVTLSVGTSVVLYLGCFLLAPALAATLNAPSATGLLRLMALGVVIDGCSSIPNALLTRNFLQGKRLIADLAGFVVSAVITVTLAATGHGATSLALGILSSNLTATVLILVMAPSRPLPGWQAGDARELLRFGLPLAATSLLWFAIQNVDYIVVGHLSNSTQLGLYMLAFNVASWPSNLLTFAIRRVAIPGFARLQGDRDAFSSAFATSMGALVSLILLPCLLLTMLAKPLVLFLYGREWLPAAAALSWLALVGSARVLLDLCYDALVGADRPIALFGLQVLWLLTLIPALTIGTEAGGIRGTALGHVVITFGVAGVSYLFMMHRGGVRLRPLARAVSRPALAGTVLLALLALGRDRFSTPLVTLVVVGGGASLCYLVLVVPPPLRRRLLAKARTRNSAAPAVSSAR
ncbi:MAG TPA: oligosaccharide flippase family protein [Jatrophihabitans sp.]|nr:oligosaccharide flippase family protein [Jatrophihabitans sp.]